MPRLYTFHAIPTLPTWISWESSRRPRSLVYEKFIDFSLVSLSLCSAWWLWPRRVDLSDRKSMKKFQRRTEKCSLGVKAGKRAPGERTLSEGTSFLSP